MPRTLKFPNEIFCEIVDYVHIRVEQTRTQQNLRMFLQVAKTCRRFFRMAELSVQGRRDAFLTDEQLKHIRQELKKQQPRALNKFMTRYTAISAWAQKFGKICAFCSNGARHSLYGEAFMGLLLCQACETFLFPKLSFGTLQKMLGEAPWEIGAFSSGEMCPYNDPANWRAYPHRSRELTPRFRQNVWRFVEPEWPCPDWLRLKSDWEVRKREAIDWTNELHNMEAYNIDKLTSWSNVKRILDHFDFMDLPNRDEICRRIKYRSGEAFGIFMQDRAWAELPYAWIVERGVSWWTFQAWKSPDGCKDIKTLRDTSLYFEFRYQFDPWWDENRNLRQLADEYSRVVNKWSRVGYSPWAVEEFPQVPSFSKILFGGSAQRVKDVENAQYYNARCASLRAFYWQNHNIIEDPQWYWKVLSKLIEREKNPPSWITDLSWEVLYRSFYTKNATSGDHDKGKPTNQPGELRL
jgi:hypothetical protein